jgi:hypothetical protein
LLDELIEWLAIRADEIVVNLATELVGVVVSIFLAVYFANYLDRRTEKRRARERTAYLYKALVDQYEYLGSGRFLFDSEIDMSRAEPWWMRAKLIRTSKQMEEKTTNILDALDREYSETLSDTRLELLERLRDLLFRVSACLQFDSSNLREMLGHETPRDRIIDVHVKWITSHDLLLEGLIQELENQYKFLGKSAHAEFVEDEVFARYHSIFDLAFPVEKFSMLDLIG